MILVITNVWDKIHVALALTNNFIICMISVILDFAFKEQAELRQLIHNT